MDIHEHFRFVARTIRNQSVYSKLHEAQVISVPHLRVLLEQHLNTLPPELPTLDDILEEGVCRGLWEMAVDHVSHVDIVVIR